MGSEEEKAQRQHSPGRWDLAEKPLNRLSSLVLKFIAQDISYLSLDSFSFYYDLFIYFSFISLSNDNAAFAAIVSDNYCFNI